jgi:hypothetical protein
MQLDPLKLHLVARLIADLAGSDRVEQPHLPGPSPADRLKP